MPETGFLVNRGPLANVLIGAEVKILAKAMIKQIDRVITDLRHQAQTFRLQNSAAVAVGIVGVNHAESYVSYEAERTYPAKPPPSREAPTAVSRLSQGAAGSYDEFLVLRFRATNVAPYPFEWVDERDTQQSYAAAVLRIAQLFESRF